MADNLDLGENSLEQSFDEFEYYAWKRGHWPWEFPRRSWAKYWLRDVLIAAAVIVTALLLVWLWTGEKPFTVDDGSIEITLGAPEETPTSGAQRSP